MSVRKKISNYDKFPFVKIDGEHIRAWTGWEEIVKEVRTKLTSQSRKKTIVAVDCYHGVSEQEVREIFAAGLDPQLIVSTSESFKTAKELDELMAEDITEDRVFGYMSRLGFEDIFDKAKTDKLRNLIEGLKSGIILVSGPGASYLVSGPDVLIYADMARWEIQQRMRKGEVSNLGVSNTGLDIIRRYKRAYFIDWRICDRHKKSLYHKIDYYLDTNNSSSPKMITGKGLMEGLEQAAQQPFRVVPFFDPGPWGGQWMREVCDLDREKENFAWCFDCVPEENSLLLRFGEVMIETPAMNLTFLKPKELLGGRVYARFGDEFPIRFDFLDTMNGGNLSLQVHPVTEYIQEHFGMHYTQDESYYMLDAGEGAVVYLGLNENIEPEEMIEDLRAAQKGGKTFPDEKYVAKWPAKKHDHFLIPAGTVHCSGKDSMVLEISATPYIFTFKLWDWGRLGMDGLPRPIHIERGKEVIQWDRTTPWVQENLINRVELQEENDHYREERTGLHEFEFIETRRHWFTGKVPHHTGGSVNVLNLIEGREAIVESPDNAFAPFIVHYAETFIIPAQVGEYTIRPFGESEGQQCATIKAFVKN